MAEEAALMVEALADVTLETTIATADADNIRQQTTINNRLGAKPGSDNGNDGGGGGGDTAMAVATATQQQWQQQKC